MIDIEKLANLYDVRINQWTNGTQPTKQSILAQLVLLRFMIRQNMVEVNEASEHWRYFRRKKNTLKHMNIEMPLLELQVKKQQTRCQSFDRTLAGFGEILFSLLDVWQQSGATREELFNLCNAHRLDSWAKQDLEKHMRDDFSQLVFVYNLDYPQDKEDFICDEVDAPFTHAIKKFMLDKMLRTPEGKEASRAALMNVFPDIMDSALTVRKDEFGQDCLYDAEGNSVS